MEKIDVQRNGQWNIKVKSDKDLEDNIKTLTDEERKQLQDQAKTVNKDK